VVVYGKEIVKIIDSTFKYVYI